MSETTSSVLQRKLSARMLSMMTIGGAISTGLFLASGSAIHLAGPGGTMLAYLIISIMVYFLMTSLAEMAALIPSTGAFYTYAAKFVDPALGYALAWNYWYGWAITVASEMSAASLIMHFWFPNSATLIWCALFLMIVMGFNAFSTRVFGEVEYWFSLIKVIVIVLFIVAGLGIVFGFAHHETVGLKNWVIDDAPFHGGGLAILSALVIAGFSFQGTEMIAIAAGECKNPRENIPKAVRQVFWRVAIFFIFSILIITLLIPYTSPQLESTTVSMSPFTLVFKYYNIAFAAGLINAVILIVIISSGNSGLYAATRMFWYLAKQGHAPALFAKVNRRGVPLYALILTSSITLLAFLSSFFGNGRVYLWLINAVSLSGFIAWLGIAISHYRFRKAYVSQGRELKALPYIAKGYPYSTLCTFMLCIIIIAGQNYAAFAQQKIDWIGMVVSYSGLPIFLGIWFGYKWVKKTKLTCLKTCSFEY